MPAKSKRSSKEAKPKGGDAPAKAEEVTKTKSVAAKKEEALSIFDQPKKKRVRKKVAPEPEPKVEEPKKKTLQDEKDEAVSLFEETERRAEAKKKRSKKILGEKEIAAKTKKGSGVLPPISQLRASEKGLYPEKKEEKEPEVVVAEAKDEAEDADGEETDLKVIHIKPPIIVKDLAERIGLKPFMLIKDLIELDVFADTNKSIEPDIAAKVCEKHGFVFEKERREKGGGVHKVEEVIEEPPAPVEEPEDELQLRAPIVAFMGHVDHGKTSLIDAIRKTSVTAGEAGGITQHVAAYSVAHGDKSITILDTPGHAAFTKMRARGADVTDVVVLVVAANDGIKPQTIEAINHAKAAGVKMVVAINKVDLDAANPDRVKGQLQEYDLAPEDWGGSTSVVEVSATMSTGLDELIEVLLLEAELLELRANPDAIARASVIESRVEAGKGPTATVIVQSGTLKIGKPFICGPFSGKVKSLLDDHGKSVKEAGPGMPVEVLGFSDLPNVGDELVEMDSDRAAKKLGDERVTEQRQSKLAKPQRTSLENLFAKGGPGKKLKLVIKTDVQGSVEAITGSLDELPQEKVEVDFLHTGAGSITESDILLASASDAIVIGFNTKLEGKAVKVAKAEGVQVKLFSIIYELIDQVKEAMLGQLDPEHRETVIGHAQIKQVFKTSKGRVGGCMVTDGRVNRASRARVLRGGQAVYDGGVHTLRRFQDEVPEVRNGLECGIKLGDFNDYEVNDVIECYELEQLPQTLT